MYHLAVGIECFSIILILVESIIVFKYWKSDVHSYLFLSCLAILVNNVGYLLQMTSSSEGGYFAALCFSYMGRVWISYSFFMFTMKLLRVRINPAILWLLVTISIATYLSVLTTKYTGFYYSSMSFEMKGEYPYLEHTNGIWHNIWNAELVLYIIVGIYALITGIRKEKNLIIRKRLTFVILSAITTSVFFLIQIFGIFSITKVYDVTSIGYTLGAICMFVAIFKYRLMDTEAVARAFVVDELSDGMVALDENGELRYFNKAALALFPALKIDKNSVVRKIIDSYEKDEPIKRNDRIYAPRMNNLNKKGQFVGTLYTLADVTEHYRYMTELKEQKAIADAANTAKSSFLANMSHEIRTPINAVLGIDEMILRESNEKEIVAYASDIRSAGRTLLSLINDILDFSKIEEGRMEIIPTEYELASMINDLVNMVRERANKKGLKLEIDADPAIPHQLFGDEIRVKQIVLNLLTNAVKYTEKGTVGLIVGFTEGSDDQILLSFTVKDTGIGIKKEDMEKLFSPFRRIEEKRNRSIEGTGLGMSIVRQLLSLMESELKVESVYGEGSTFSFEIKQKVAKREPMGDISSRLEKEATERKAYQELFHAPDASLLVVDDTEMNLKVIKHLLKKTGVKIDTVTTGKEALESARNNDYDVVFIDHMMPDMDGIETLHRMKEDFAGTPDRIEPVYIALTANAVSGAKEMYLAEGFMDYISKPVEGKVLEEKLKTYLPDDKMRY